LCKIIQKNISSDFISEWMRNIQKIQKSWKLAAKKLSKRKISKKIKNIFCRNFSKKKKKNSVDSN
jgi:hypothetical protein